MASVQASPGPPPARPPTPSVPDGWKVWWAQESQKWYYHELATGNTQWDPPGSVPPPPPPPAPQAAEAPSSSTAAAPTGDVKRNPFEDATASPNPGDASSSSPSPPPISHMWETGEFFFEFTDEAIEYLREIESEAYCASCLAVFHNGIVIPHADDAIPCPGRSCLIQVAHHWTPKSVTDALEMGCILCSENLADIPALQEAERKCDEYGPGKKPVTVFRFFGNEANSGATGLQIKYYSDETPAMPDAWSSYLGKSRYRVTRVNSSAAGVWTIPRADDFLDRVLEWANTCRDTHQGCGVYRGLMQRIIPQHILEIGESHLVLRSLELGWDETYITLSHRWSIPGRPDPPKLCRANEAEMRSLGIPFSSLPPAFRDAAILARHLGVRYLWIDSLCIFQDDAADWESQVPYMGNIYGGGLVNIAIVDEESYREGWVRRGPCEVPIMSAPSNPALQSLRTEWGPSVESMPILLHDCMIFKETISQSMLLARGWVHQEVLTAPATLYLTRQEAWWVCNGLFSSEVYPRGAPHFIESFGIGNIRRLFLYYPFETAEAAVQLCHAAWDSWVCLITAFSRAEFTYESDRVKALFGVILELSYFLGHPFAGHWYPVFPNNDMDFVPQLLWRCAPGSNPRLRNSTEGSLGDNTGLESGGPVIPTWSWLSCPSMIVYFGLMPGITHFVRLITEPDLGELDWFAWPRTRMASALHLGVVLVPLAPNPLFTPLLEVISGPLVSTNGERAAPAVSIAVDRAEYVEEMRTQSETSNGSMDGYFFIPFSHRRSLAIYGLAVREQKERSEDQHDRRFFQRVGNFIVDAKFTEAHAFNVEYSEEAWSYVFDDWSLGRLGRKVVRDLDLCNDWMMAEEEPNLDEIYLV
ncbi:hypothetical protein GGTG_04184 [Gaeumannomyces tritici R3-111a-1]|uniref:WW domain-containing protein n=1 Tax=Gaeumannomyces tritici (strain R3-111a-1) TaxID=644352 RepID=J3NSD8_GAET3|nr:hypothetical protein GGTG_04184 [Gaeumannomyces tritici R3-111a-1]EJT79095.1 hypothetical protein GGTG_04184 [Gaeumannomyces tritici R3-111a-1]